jgi:hypothetical protein
VVTGNGSFEGKFMKYLLLSIVFIVGCEISFNNNQNEEIFMQRMKEAKKNDKCVAIQGIKPEEIRGQFCIKYLGELK